MELDESPTEQNEQTISPDVLFFMKGSQNNIENKHNSYIIEICGL